MDKLTRRLLVLSLAACFLALTVKMTVGALPNQLKAARMTDATLASTIDNEVGNLETAITDILGIPIDTNISAAGFVWAAAGLQRLVFQGIADPGTPASGNVWLSTTTANTLKYYDGTTTRSVVDLSLTQTLSNKTFVAPVLGAASGTSLSLSGTSNFLNNNAAGTAEKYILIANTGGELRVGVESSVGGSIISGTQGYSTVLGTAAGRRIEFATSGVVRAVIDSSGQGIAMGTISFGAGSVNVLTIANGTAPGALANTASLVVLAGKLWAYDSAGVGTKLTP